MIISPNQHKSFAKSITDFASRNGLSVDIFYDSLKNVTTINICNAARPHTLDYKAYRVKVHWDDKENVMGVVKIIIKEMVDYFDIKASVSDPFKIKKVIFNDPYTIVLWEDDTKTVVKTQNDEYYDCEKGLAMCISKKALGNNGNYYNTFVKYSDGLVSYCGVTQDSMNDLEETLTKSHKAYNRLVNCLNNKKATKDVLWASIEEAARYLGEVLDI